jgi:tripartite-type tricarboxylate transporter receptor subunit TctC
MSDMRNGLCSAACASIAALMILASFAAHGQTPFPSRMIRIVSSQAGGSNDLSSRLIAEEMQRSLGQPVVVDNRTGGVIAGTVVVKAPPDGYTVLHYGNTFWLLPLMRTEMPYDPIKDFVPIAGSIISINMLVVHPSLPVKSVRDLIALGKSRPDMIDYSSAAAGTSNHLAAELFKSRAGVTFRRIPFKGAASALNSVVTGEVQVHFPTYATVAPFMGSAKLRVLGVATLKPTDIAPGIPTIASELPGFEASGRFGFFASAATPPAIVSLLHKEIVAALTKPTVRDRLRQVGAEPEASTGQEFAAAIRKEIQDIGKIIKELGIRDQ